MKLLYLTDLAYIAGFLDGDGSIIAQFVPRNDYKWGYQIRLTIQFTQKSTRRIYLQKLLDLTGVGYIRNRGEEKSQVWQATPAETAKPSLAVSDLVITDVKHVHAFLKQLQPYLKIKQKQANLALRLIEQMPLAKNSLEKFIENVKLVDQISALNDSKSRQITGDIVMKHLLSLKQ